MPATYTLINSNVLSSSAASVTFSAIPATYTDLVVRVSARSDMSGLDEVIKIVFNSDSGSSTDYSFTYLIGSGSTASSSGFSNRAFSWALYTDGNTATSNTFGSTEIYLPNYTSTSAKPHSAFSVSETNATTVNIGATAGLYRAATAISSIAFTPVNGTNWLSGSSFYLYGISNA